MPTNDHDLKKPGDHDSHVRDGDHPGYETTDVNAGGIAVFLAGLFGSVLVFFVFCFVMGKVINSAIEKDDVSPRASGFEDSPRACSWVFSYRICLPESTP